MKKQFKDYQLESSKMVSRFMNGDKNITLRDIDLQSDKERFQYYLDYCSLNRSYLIPIVFIPVVLYWIFWD